MSQTRDLSPVRALNRSKAVSSPIPAPRGYLSGGSIVTQKWAIVTLHLPLLQSQTMLHFFRSIFWLSWLFSLLFLKLAKNNPKSVEEWLQAINMGHYVQEMIESGWDDVDYLDFTYSDLIEVGIHSEEDREFVSSIYENRISVFVYQVDCLVFNVGESPSWPIESPNKGRKSGKEKRGYKIKLFEFFKIS